MLELTDLTDEQILRADGSMSDGISVESAVAIATGKDVCPDCTNSISLAWGVQQRARQIRSVLN